MHYLHQATILNKEIPHIYQVNLPQDAMTNLRALTDSMVKICRTSYYLDKLILFSNSKAWGVKLKVLLKILKAIEEHKMAQQVVRIDQRVTI
jgi:hypothetical protein